MNRARNRQMILKIIKKRKALEKEDLKSDEGVWVGKIQMLNYWKFLKDLEEGRITHLNGKKVG